MSKFYIPEDGYESRLSQALGATDVVAYVDALPSSVTAGYLTIFELDGKTIRCKIKFTGVGSSPTRLTGVTFISLTDPAETAVTGTSCPKNSKIALTDNIHYTGKALSAMNGDIPTGGVMRLPTVRTISDPRDTIDKEYADGLAIAGYSAFFVTQDGADPSLAVNIAAGQYIKEDGSSDYFAGASALAVADDDTNYVELSTAGVASVNTVGFTAGAFPLAVVTTVGGDIVSIDDRRALLGGNDGIIDKTRTWTTVQSLTADNLQVTSDPDGANDAVRKSYLDSLLAYGDGSDGEFSSSSGTTIWNTAGKTVYQFTDFTLSGTGALTLGANLINQPITVLVQGDLTITSSATPAIELTGLGGAGGAGGTGNNAGAVGTNGAQILSYGSAGSGGSGQGGTGNYTAGSGGGGASVNGNGVAGSAGTVAGGAGGKGTNMANTFILAKALAAFGCGGGGGGGGSTGGLVGGAGGAGGGSIIFIVKGNINITSTIYAKGVNGGGGNSSSGSYNYYSGCGGGGGGGFVGIFYAGSVTANSATITVTKGSAGGGSGDGADGLSKVQRITNAILGI